MGAMAALLAAMESREPASSFLREAPCQNKYKQPEVSTDTSGCPISCTSMDHRGDAAGSLSARA